MSIGLGVRPALASDWPRMVEILNGDAYEPVTVDVMVRFESQQLSAAPYLKLVAEAPDGSIVGFGRCFQAPGREPGVFEFQLHVDAPFRGQGAGRALYAALLAWAREQGARRIAAVVHDGDAAAIAWIERRAYLRERHLFRSELMLADFDPSAFAGAVERVKAQGIRYVTFEDAVRQMGEEAYRRFYDFLDPIVADVPGTEGRLRAPYERWRANMNDPGIIFLAVDAERWAAFAVARRLPAGGLQNALTGVARDYRGRGIALALKVHVLDYLKRQGEVRITTSNHSNNPAILAVNAKLGYRAMPGTYTYARQL